VKDILKITEEWLEDGGISLASRVYLFMVDTDKDAYSVGTVRQMLRKLRAAVRKGHGKRSWGAESEDGYFDEAALIAYTEEGVFLGVVPSNYAR
jgi:hypothetical protein